MFKDLDNDVSVIFSHTLLVGPLLLSRTKYRNTYWMDWCWSELFAHGPHRIHHNDCAGPLSSSPLSSVESWSSYFVISSN